MFFDLLATFVNAVGSFTEKNAASKAASYNRRIDLYNATVTEQQGQIAEQQLRQSSQRDLGRLRANIGASGLASSGSALDLLQESAYNAEMDALNVRYNAKTKATGYRMEAGLQKNRASSEKTGAYLSASGILLAGAGKAYKEDASATGYGIQPFRLGN